MAKEIFEERGIEFIPTQVYDTSKSVDELHEIGARAHEEHIDDITAYDTEDPDSQEVQLERLVNEYHWGAIHTRPHLDRKALAICALSSMTALGHYDQQIRRCIEGALRIGMTLEEIMEVFIQLTLYGGYFNTRTAMRIARSVFTEQGLSEKEERETKDRTMSGEAS
jgi:4-carboxymuconolactone decarboxylase